MVDAYTTTALHESVMNLAFLLLLLFLNKAAGIIKRILMGKTVKKIIIVSQQKMLNEHFFAQEIPLDY